MANRERGLIRLIMKHFVASLKPRVSKRTLVGEDYYGTKYYEVTVTSNSRFKKPPRYFTPTATSDFQQEIPAEWEAWLRYRREHPPTDEEVKASYEMILLKRKNAAELEAKHLAAKNENAPTVQEEQSVEKTSLHSFPIYKEYEHYGQGYKPRRE